MSEITHFESQTFDANKVKKRIQEVANSGHRLVATEDARAAIPVIAGLLTREADKGGPDAVRSLLLEQMRQHAA